MSENLTVSTRIDEFIERGKAYLKQYTERANIIKAQKCFSEAYALCSTHFGKDDVKNIEILSLLSASHNYHIGLQSSSIEVTGLLEEMKRIQLLNNVSISPDLIETCKRLATSYAQSKKFEMALENYIQVLDMQCKSRSDDYADIAHTLERIGDVYRHLEKSKKAHMFYLKAYDLYKTAGGETGNTILKLEHKISRVTPMVISNDNNIRANAGFSLQVGV